MSKSKLVGFRAVKRTVRKVRVLKRYEGKRINGRPVVTVNGRALEPRLDLRMHSPEGFDWGDIGPGPAQLGIALLADCLRDDREALARYRYFVWKVLARLPKRDDWLLTGSGIRRILESAADETSC